MIQIGTPVRLCADERAEVVLSDDAAVQEANPWWAIAAYQDTGDASVLSIPEDATVFVLRPLTTDQSRAAVTRAGREPMLGARIVRRVEMALVDQPEIEALKRAADEAVRAAHKAREADAPEDEQEAAYSLARDRLRDHAVLVSEVRARALDALADDEMRAWQARIDWAHRHACELVRAALVEIRNGPGLTPNQFVDALLAGDADSRSIAAELAAHVQRVSTVGGRGKAPSGGPSGPTDTTTPTSGAARTATTPTSTGSAAGAEGFSPTT